MVSYQGPAINPEDGVASESHQEFFRGVGGKGHSRIEPCLIQKIYETNEVDIALESGDELKKVRLLNTQDEIYLIYGKTNDLKNLPGTLQYEDSKASGFVKIENIFQTKVKKDLDKYQRPFYL